MAGEGTKLWKPGESGNPGGLTSEQALAVRTLRTQLAKLSPKMVSVLEGILDNQGIPAKVKLDAIFGIMDRIGVKDTFANQEVRSGNIFIQALLQQGKEEIKTIEPDED